MSGILSSERMQELLLEHYREHFGEREDDILLPCDAENILRIKRGDRLIILNCHITKGSVTHKMKQMKAIILGADHGGYELKEQIKAHLTERGFEVSDVGTHSAESCDYPVYASRLCQEILDGQAELGILVCGTGVGMSIAANKHRGIRACCCSEPFSAEMTRRHNDSNVLCLGGRVVDTELGLALADIFVDTEFEGDRHIRRLDLIEKIENGEEL